MFFFQLRNELWKMFGKKRTYMGFAIFFFVQSALVLAMRFFSGPQRQMMRGMARSGYPAEHYLSNLTIATATLFATAFLLLPLFIALVGGDLVAKEAEDGTLRMILSRPISRLRLLVLKWLGGLCFAAVLVLAFGLFGALFARLFFPAGGLFAFFRGEGITGAFEGWESWGRYGLAHLVLIAQAGTIMSLAFMFSCMNMKPAAATILAIALIFVSMIMQQFPYFVDWQDWFLTHHLNTWRYCFQQVIPWPVVGKSLGILAGYNAAFLIVGAFIFQRRDIKS